MAVYKRGKVWWYKFVWRGERIRESTSQSNKRVAEQMEAARKTQFAKGEVGLRDRKPVPTLAQFADRDFMPFVRSTFAAKRNTLAYYRAGARSLTGYVKLADEPVDRITTEHISGFIAKRQSDGLEVSSINRELQVLRRMFHLALEWGKVEKVLPLVKMLPGERHRDRVLTSQEEAKYLGAAEPLLRDVATVLLDCGIRPEECFRLKWGSVREGCIEIHYGKTNNARRRIPLSQRVAVALEMRQTNTVSEWVFPARTRSGHIEPASLKRQHVKACTGQSIEPFPLYTLRHTCLTRWAPHMDPWTLAYLAGHRDMSITRRYVHPQEHTIRDAMQKARSGHGIGHSIDRVQSDELGKPAVIN